MVWVVRLVRLVLLMQVLMLVLVVALMVLVLVVTLIVLAWAWFSMIAYKKSLFQRAKCSLAVTMTVGGPDFHELIGIHVLDHPTVHGEKHVSDNQTSARAYTKHL